MKEYALTRGDLGSRKTTEKSAEAIVLLCNELSPKWENGRGLTRAGRAEHYTEPEIRLGGTASLDLGRADRKLFFL